MSTYHYFKLCGTRSACTLHVRNSDSFWVHGQYPTCAIILYFELYKHLYSSKISVNCKMDKSNFISPYTSTTTIFTNGSIEPSIFRQIDCSFFHFSFDLDAQLADTRYVVHDACGIDKCLRNRLHSFSICLLLPQTKRYIIFRIGHIVWVHHIPHLLSIYIYLYNVLRIASVELLLFLKFYYNCSERIVKSTIGNINYRKIT